MTKLRIIIETDVSAWTAEQVAAYQQLIRDMLKSKDNKLTWIIEESEE